ncbi:MAG: hypothetical protein Q4C12_01150 [Clostridia bacterium]|nr:hypothetical protein [Clostridia bacterium]
MNKAIFFIALILVVFSILMPAFAANEMASTADFTTHSFNTVSGRANISFDLTADTVSSGFIGSPLPTLHPHTGVNTPSALE